MTVSGDGSARASTVGRRSERYASGRKITTIGRGRRRLKPPGTNEKKTKNERKEAKFRFSFWFFVCRRVPFGGVVGPSVVLFGSRF